MSVYPDNLSNTAFNQHCGTPSPLSLDALDTLEDFESEWDNVRARMKEIDAMPDDENGETSSKYQEEYEELEYRLMELRSHIASFDGY